MRGFPLINLLAVALALVALLIPLLRLNTPARAAVESTAALAHGEDGRPAAAEVPVSISLRFVREPLKLEMKVEGRVLNFTGSGLERTARTALPLRDGAFELDTAVSWPADAAGSVVEISVAPDGREELRQNLWAEGAEASDILRFEWKK